MADQASASQYQYERLPEGSFIRLVELLPRLAEDERVRCFLHEVAFGDNTPPYETLSYCWGQASDLKHILCNDQILCITRTLHQALNELRDKDKSRLIWIDQICINQQDDEEKTSQVLMMREIYSRSSLTTAWLGESNDETENALQALSRISRAEAVRALHGSMGADSKPSQKEINRIDILFNRPWFSRMWIIQEAAVSKRLVLLCGSTCIDIDHITWGLLCAFATAFGSRDFSSPSHTRYLFLSGLRQIPHADPRLRLERLLEASRGFQASDIRDKLYALYGITSTNMAALGLSPDYALPADAVFIRTIYRLSEHLQSLRLLEMVDMRADDKSTLPSWLPRLRKTRQTASLLIDSSGAEKGWAEADDVALSVVKAAVDDGVEIEGLDMTDEDVRHAFMAGFTEWWDGERRDTGADRSNDNTTESGATNDARSFTESPSVAASRDLPLSTFVLEDDNSIRLGGQLVDKVQELSAVLERMYVDTETFHNEIEALSPDDRLTTHLVVGGFRTAGGWLANLYRRAKQYAAALRRRDEMVMARKDVPYPNGDPLMTAYRMTVTAGLTSHRIEDLDGLFREWRKLFRPAQDVSRFLQTVKLTRTPGLVDLMGLLVGNQRTSTETKMMFYLIEASYCRRLVWTQRGYLALVPQATVQGDLIVILVGGRVPFVVRPTEAGHRLVGPAYVHGMMNGELFDEDSCGDIRLV